MSTNLIVTDLQKLDPGSGYIHLFEMQITENPDTFIYFCNEFLVPGSNTKVTFRDSESPYTERTYNVIPSIMEDIEKATEGSLPRPKLTIANVFRTQNPTSLEGAIYVSNSNSAIPFDQLLGLKFIRRTTLKKYLASEVAAGNIASPPIEFPKEVYYMDRISEETNQTVTFELVAPFDLVGITLPRRNVISVGCPWEYQGSGSHLFAYERKGGCHWNQESKVVIEGTTYTFYVNRDDEYVLGLVDSNFTLYEGSADKSSYYRTIGATATRINSNGTLTTGIAVTDYWQSVTGENTTPADNHSDWRRIRLYTVYSTSTDYAVYLEDRYNSYVTHSSNETVKEATVGVNRLWKASHRTSENITPEFNRFWQRGDVCQKRLNSCAARFGAQGGSVDADFATSPTTADNYPIVDLNANAVLPFGGFPTARNLQ